jgi:indole-3-glycerol phosphate synthase
MTILDEIVATKRQEILHLPAVENIPLCRQDFSYLQKAKPILIAEIKAASPSEGNIVTGSFDPLAIARDYEAGGADAFSILTDESYFKGSFKILQQVRAITAKPLLCKEFILDDRQIRYARFCGADLCLLIVKILDPDQLKHLKQTVESFGMKAVVEVQNEAELKAAQAVGADILLINNRNLTNFTVDQNTTLSLLHYIPDGVVAIAASGIQQPEEIKTYPSRINGFLIGTALMRSADRIAFLKRCRA